MRKFSSITLIAVFIFSLVVNSSWAQEEIRVKVEVVGDHKVDTEAKKYITNALDLLEDVQCVDEGPQVYVHIIARRLVTNRGRRLGYVMGTASSEIIEILINGENPLALSDYNGLWVEMGPNLRNLCDQCVTAINSGVLTTIRNQR